MIFWYVHKYNKRRLLFGANHDEFNKSVTLLHIFNSYSLYQIINTNLYVSTKFIHFIVFSILISIWK